MPGTSSIRWRKKDREKISRTVQQFNAKITRTLKKHPELKPFLPERLTVKEVTANIQTRKDFNRSVNSYQRFLKKGAEKPVTTKSGIKTTQWEKKEVAYKVAQINRARTLERKRANVSSFTGTMGSIQANNLKPKKYNPDTIKPNDWKKFIQGVEKQVKENYYTEKNIVYQNNYLQAVRNIFGSKGNELIKIVSKIPPDRFIDLFYADAVLQIDFIYDPLEAELIIETIIEHLEEYGYT